MEKQTFDAVLAQHLDAPARERLGEEDSLFEDPPQAPYGNFFDDELFTLLYRSTDPCVGSLREAKAWLEAVADQKQARHLRARAALNLGRFVQQRRPDPIAKVLGVSLPREWFALARQMGSVIGAHAFANCLLAYDSMSVRFDLKVDPLPCVVSKVASKGDVSVASPVSRAWYLGARTACRHVQRHFEGWGREDFGCALACVVNYLVLPSEDRGFGFHAVPVAPASQALVWMLPLWSALIRWAPHKVPNPDAYHAALIDQRCVVFLRLKELERDNADPHSPAGTKASVTSAADSPPATPVAAAGGGKIVVIRGEIPVSTDREEKSQLKLYEALRAPVGLAPLPSRARLVEVRRTLEAEFPWATQAIGAVMGELFARRRHGVLRLGLFPILLVGLPGTGKTYFAQRLSDLLDTPNTVINLAGMSDVKLLKGVTRGWSSNRPSRILEFIQQTKIANPLFVLDEIDKAGSYSGNGGDPQEALLDLLEPGNAARYQDIYLMAECDLSYCLYVATSNSLERVPAPLLSRLRPVYFPPPGPEHAETIAQGIAAGLARRWGLPEGVLTVTPRQIARLRGLAPREMRRALLDLLGRDADEAAYTLH